MSQQSRLISEDDAPIVIGLAIICFVIYLVAKSVAI